MPETAPRLAALREHEPRIPLQIDRAAADSAALEIPCSFASDTIVEDSWNGPMQLSMDPSAIDLAEAQTRGIPVQEMHARNIPVGRVVGVRLESGRLLGTIRFSRSERGKQLYQDCVDGIITDTSVGAVITAVREESSHLVALRWKPREVSLVDRGADPTVGIARAADPAAPPTGVNPMPEPTPAAESEGSAGTLPPVAATAGGSDGQRSVNIMELARYAQGRAPELGIERLAQDYIQFGQPFEEFRGKVWSLLSERKAKEPSLAYPDPAAQIGLSPRESKQFSIVRACNAALTGDWKKAGFELEASRAVADRLGRAPRGFFVPLEVQADIGRAAIIQRAETLSAGNPTYGGFLVGTDHRPDLFIDALRSTSVAMTAGVRTLTGLVGNLSIPKKTSVGTFSWISEGEDAPDTDIQFGAVAMSPRTIAGGIAMTRRLLQQSSPSVEALVRMDLVDGCALALDLAIFEGDGVKAPRGIVNHPSINTVSVTTDGTPTWAEVVQLETEIETDNALVGALGYITTPAVVGKMKVTPKATNQAIFIMDDNGSVNGYPVRRTTQLSTNALLFGDWSQILVGYWGVLDIKPDEAKLAASGGLVIRAFQDADVAVRHGESFAKAT
jgi:HK97 family phage major capsid protein